MVLFSSVLQYLENPYTLLEKIKKLDMEFIIIDRTPFNLAPGDRLTVQTVPTEIYAASYPCWFFDKARFFRFIEDTYTIVARFESPDRANIPATFEGCILRKR